MSFAAPMLGVAGALALGAISPGPSFVLVARTAVASSRSDGVAAALGMGLGGVAFAVAALLGLHAVLGAVPWLYVAMKVLGGGYLLYLGIRIWRGASGSLAISSNNDVGAPRRMFRSFILGLATQLSNPKTAIVYASVFAALLPPDLPPAMALAIPAMVFAIEAGWYAIVALSLSSARPRAGYLRYKSAIDRSAGAVMGLLGAKLISAAHRS